MPMGSSSIVQINYLLHPTRTAHPKWRSTPYAVTESILAKDGARAVAEAVGKAVRRMAASKMTSKKVKAKAKVAEALVNNIKDNALTTRKWTMILVTNAGAPAIGLGRAPPMNRRKKDSRWGNGHPHWRIPRPDCYGY